MSDEEERLRAFLELVARLDDERARREAELLAGMTDPAEATGDANRESG